MEVTHQGDAVASRMQAIAGSNVVRAVLYEDRLYLAHFKQHSLDRIENRPRVWGISVLVCFEMGGTEPSVSRTQLLKISRGRGGNRSE